MSFTDPHGGLKRSCYLDKEVSVAISVLNTNGVELSLPVYDSNVSTVPLYIEYIEKHALTF